MVRLLLDRGARANVANNEGWTPLMEAAARGGAGVVALLIEKEADVNAKNKAGRTALQLAEEKGYSQIAEILKAAGAEE